MFWAGGVHAWQCNGLGETLGSMFSSHPNKEVFGDLAVCSWKASQHLPEDVFFLGKKHPCACRLLISAAGLGTGLIGARAEPWR